jgi:hypothetical protein
MSKLQRLIEKGFKNAAEKRFMGDGRKFDKAVIYLVPISI